MNVKVSIKNSCRPSEAGTKINITVGPAETAFALQERIAEASETLCFPEQQLLFKGEIIAESACVSASGIENGDELEFLFTASEETLVKQLSDLLGNKAMSPEELSHLYGYRHFVSLDVALRTVGHGKGKLLDFLSDQKCFCCEDGLVKVGAPKKTPDALRKSRTIGVRVSIETNTPQKALSSTCMSEDEDDMVSIRLEDAESVARAKEVIATAHQVAFRDLDLMLGKKKLDDALPLYKAGVTNGAHLVMVVHASESALVSQLVELLTDRAALSPSDLSLNYCSRFGVPVGQALRLLGLRGDVKPFLERHSQFCITDGCVTLA